MRDLSNYKVSAPGYVTLKGRYVTVEPFVREQHLQALWDGLGGMGINPLLLYFAQDDRAKVAAALEPFRDIEVGAIDLTHMKLARLPIQPHSYYEMIDVVAEIPMLGAAHRGGYHN